jgi:hypothetical protein
VDLQRRLGPDKKSAFFSATDLNHIILEHDNFLWFEIIKVSDSMLISIEFLIWWALIDVLITPT